MKSSIISFMKILGNFFFFTFSTACLRLVAPLSSAGWVPCVFFLLEWINGKNLMNVRSKILIWLILYQLEFQVLRLQLHIR